MIRSIRRSFALSVHEINGIRRKWCCDPSDKRLDKRGKSVCRGRRFKPGPKQLQCILNVYRQGPRWSHDWRTYRCKPKRHIWMTEGLVAKRAKRCRLTNRYYLWNFCFAKGIVLGKRARRSCRWAYAKWWIDHQYK
jgi:hypothetical protein